MKALHIVSLTALVIGTAVPAFAQTAVTPARPAQPAGPDMSATNLMDHDPFSRDSLPGAMQAAAAGVTPDQFAPRDSVVGATAAPSAASAGVNASAVAPQAPSTSSVGLNASVTAPAGASVTQLAPGSVLISSPPVPDTPETRRLYGGPESRGGRLTAPVGN